MAFVTFIPPGPRSVSPELQGSGGAGPVPLRSEVLVASPALEGRRGQDENGIRGQFLLASLLTLYSLCLIKKNKHFLNKQTKNFLREDTGYGDRYFLNIKKAAVWEFQFCVQPSFIFPSAG